MVKMAFVSASAATFAVIGFYLGYAIHGAAVDVVVPTLAGGAGGFGAQAGRRFGQLRALERAGGRRVAQRVDQGVHGGLTDRLLGLGGQRNRQQGSQSNRHQGRRQRSTQDGGKKGRVLGGHGGVVLLASGCANA